MKRTVHKYEIVLGRVHCPKGAKLVLAGMQGDRYYLWMEVDEAQFYEAREFHVYCTGDFFPEDHVHVQSFQDEKMGLVLHVYEKIK